MSAARVTLWIATLAALGLLIRSWLLDPLPGVWLSLVWVALLGFVALGLSRPSMQMFAPVLLESPDDEPELVLTFDGIPPLAELRSALNRLHAAAISATFCVPLEQIERENSRPTLQRLVEAGHTLALLDEALTRRLPSVERLKAASKLLEEGCGQAERVLPLLRSQRRMHTPDLARRAKQAGFGLLGGSVGWPKRCRSDDAFALRHGVRRGAVLCVDAALASREVVSDLAAEASLRGLRWVSLQTWLD